MIGCYRPIYIYIYVHMCILYEVTQGGLIIY